MSIAQEVPPPAPVAEAPWTADLELERAIRRGMGGQHVRLVQGWLGLDGFHVAVDGEFGPATQRAVREFQRASGLPDSGVVDGATYELLTAPMRMALAPLPRRGRAVGALVVAAAWRHLAARAREIGGQNRGPWVRLYTGGLEGAAYPWCAGFATLCLQQACASLGGPMPIPTTLACDVMADASRAAGAFLPSPGEGRATTHRSGELLPAQGPERGIRVRPLRDRRRGGSGLVHDDRGQHERRRSPRGVRGLRAHARVRRDGFRAGRVDVDGRCRPRAVYCGRIRFSP